LPRRMTIDGKREHSFHAAVQEDYMKIAWKDARQLFDFGGFIDLETGEYIFSKWRYDSLRQLAMQFQDCEVPSIFPVKDYTVDDYKRFACEKDRYLRIADFNSTAILREAALHIGISEEQLSGMGFNNEDTNNIMFPVLEEAIFDHHILTCEDSLVVKNNLFEFVRSNHMYVRLMSEYSRLWKDLMKNWLTEHGIDPDF